MESFPEQRRSAQGTEKVYKEGMRKDTDGFMDIQWCGTETLDTWDQLRKTQSVRRRNRNPNVYKFLTRAKSPR